MGLLDMLSAEAGSPQAAQLQGLFGGLLQAGSALSPAGQFRPVGTPAPSLADAIGAFGTGRRAAMVNAFQSAEMEKKQRRAGLLDEARSSKPDDAISPEARAIRGALSGLPDEVRALADGDQLPQLAIQRATQRVTPMDAARATSLGLRPGTVGFENAWTGAPTILQQPDYLSPEAEAQRARIANASRAAPSPVEVNGRLVDPRTGRVIYDGGTSTPMTPANAWNDILRLAPAAAAGTLDPNSTEGQRYLAAQTVLTQPRPVDVTRPDGSVERVMQAPEFPFPRLQPAGTTTPAQGTPPPGGAMPAPPAGAAPAGLQIKPPPEPKPLTESQGNATMYLQRMQEAEKRLEAVTNEGYRPGGIRDRIAAGVPGVGNFALSEQGQLYKQAQEDWVRAKLRKESGAVIAKEEMDAEIKTYFPQPGDSPRVIQQKAAARQTAVDAMGSSAGPGAGRIVNTAPAVPTAPRDPLGILK